MVDLGHAGLADAVALLDSQRVPFCLAVGDVVHLARRVLVQQDREHSGGNVVGKICVRMGADRRLFDSLWVLEGVDEQSRIGLVHLGPHRPAEGIIRLLKRRNHQVPANKVPALAGGLEGVEALGPPGADPRPQGRCRPRVRRRLGPRTSGASRAGPRGPNTPKQSPFCWSRTA